MEKEPASNQPEVAHSERPPGKAQRTRASLIEATCDELSESGSFTAERVAKRAGTSVATFYVHLPTKELALVAVFERVMGELVSVVDQQLKVERLLEYGLEPLMGEFVQACIDFFSERMLVMRAGLAALPDSRELRQVYREHEGLAFKGFSRFISLGQAAGQIRSGSVEELARTFLVLSQGLNNPLLFDPEARLSLPGHLTSVLAGWLKKES
ncbi:MAG: TetR/AcrR family transcriptional regulator [Myxococcota bacterium]|nr:TetR/AcrR family transcriptional regulator [Myxococcota bacterium]